MSSYMELFVLEFTSGDTRALQGNSVNVVCMRVNSVQRILV